ncbi:acyl transferase 1 [Setaria viridis]|nr:acyl transferase 1-like [Setaria viridis]
MLQLSSGQHHRPKLTSHLTQTMVTFTAHRGKPELVTPARVTPSETKTLSDMDDHYGHRVYIPLVEFFRCRPTDGRHGQPEDPAVAVKAALAEALVHYYPVAGRMQETANGKLVVDCTGEGVSFVEADAAVRLEELGTPLLPPYPCVEELLPDAGNIQVVAGKPIVAVQVTRFLGGGFAIGLQISHCIADGFGMIQFLKAIADMARGQSAPTALPVWERHLLMAREPPDTAYVQQKLMSLLKNATGETPPSMVYRHFFFGPAEVSVLRSHVPGDLGASCTRFELLTAAIWRCRAAVWGFNDDHRAVLAFSANVRRRWEHIPRGYYGNALVYHVVDAAAGELRRSPLSHAVALIRDAKTDMSDEHVRSTADFMASMRGHYGRGCGGGDQPPMVYDEAAYMVSDWTRLGEDDVDFGWAERVGGGVAMPSSHVSFNGTCRNSDGDELVVASMLLPEGVVERFEKEVALLLKQEADSY